MKVLLTFLAAVAAATGVFTQTPAVPPPASVFLEDLTWLEVRDAIAAGKTTVIIPTGGTEQNGPHMVLGKHNYLVKYKAGQIAEQLRNALVAPVVAYVPEGGIDPPTGHMRFAGTISTPQDVFVKVLESAARSLRQHGFVDIVFIGDSGGNQDGQKLAADALNKEWAATNARVHHITAYYPGRGDEFVVSQGVSAADVGSHAGTHDTSSLMYLNPSMLRVDKMGPGKSGDGQGHVGNPAKATALFGKRILEMQVEDAVKQIRELRASSRQTGGRGANTPSGPPPAYADLDYAPPEPATSNGHRLDLYIPRAAAALPVVVWTGGSAWMADTGKRTAAGIAAQLNPAGYAVAGVSIRSSSQVKFPGQLHDIKGAIRWLRANARRYNLDPDRIAIMGDSSGGWTTAMAALTGDEPRLEGSIGTTGVSSKVQAAVAFYPPTNFLTMDAWALRRCTPPNCHDNENSPESRLIGCAIQTCAEKVQAADPARYISDADPPIMILHGGSDPLVPHNQGEQLYMALNKACRDAVFLSLPRAGHGPWNGFLTDDAIREAATMRSTGSAGCTVVNPAPHTPSWKTVIDFLDKYLRE